jgi:hypothetical protein
MVTRRRALRNVHILPPDVVPISPEDYEKAVTALAQMIKKWWHEHHHFEPERAGPGDNVQP